MYACIILCLPVQDLESKLPDGYHITEQRLFRFKSKSAAVSADFECSEILTATLQPGKVTTCTLSTFYVLIIGISNGSNYSNYCIQLSHSHIPAF